MVEGERSGVTLSSVRARRAMPMVEVTLPDVASATRGDVDDSMVARDEGRSG
jgi:hypothetical protein